ncbi:MAG: hypothetical protein KME29_06255 [Calothrix sp. FI2-JRJ7]|jgi:hypothetical protein|nr:hypothetical protein [Calothrix sp. FI2-JRJ7]
MRTNIDKSKKSLIFLALSLSSYIGFLLLGLYFRPAPLANFLGCLALLVYTATLAPSLEERLSTQLTTTKNKRSVTVIRA